jgi:hypothetical protein
MLTSVKSTRKLPTPFNISLLQISCCFTLPSGFGTNVTYRTIDAMKIPPDVCRKIKGEPITSSRTLQLELLEFGTQTDTDAGDLPKRKYTTVSFLIGKSEKNVENTNFVKYFEHRYMKLPFIGKLHFRSKIKTSLEHKLPVVQSSLQLPSPASTKFFSVPSTSPMFLFSSSLRRKSSCFYMWARPSSTALCFSWKS